MKKGSAFLIVVLFLSGCFGQKPNVPDCTQEDQVVKESGMPYNIGEFFKSLNGAETCYVPDSGQEAFKNVYDVNKYEPYFPLLFEDIKKDTELLKSGKISPLVIDYKEATKAGVDPEAFYYIKSNLKPEEKKNVYELLNDFDKPAQIEAAKAYGVNLEFNELEFFAKDPYGANKVLQGGYNDIEDKYIEEVMKSFNADLSKYLTRGALKDDGSITNEDLNGLNWFATEHPKMSSAMKSHFYSAWHPTIGTVDSIHITDESVRDPRAYASAPEEAKYLIPKEGYKVVVDVSNPGDYIKDGRRYIHVDTYAEKEAKKNGENPMKFYTTNANSRETWFFDDPLVLGPSDLSTERIDHAVSTVNGKFYVTSGIRVYSGKSETNLWTGWGNYYYYYGNKMDVGADRLVDMVCDGYDSDHDSYDIIYIYRK